MMAPRTRRASKISFAPGTASGGQLDEEDYIQRRDDATASELAKYITMPSTWHPNPGILPAHTKG
jgi:hypothetical protein